MNLNHRHLLFGIFSSALVVFAFEPIRRLISLSLIGSNNHLSYIPLIPFISAGLIYWKKEKVFRILGNSVIPASLFGVLGGILYYAGRTYQTRLVENDYLTLMTASVIALCLSGFLLVYGAAAFKAGLFPLLFLALAIPLPERILSEFVRLLQHGSADMVSVLFSLTGTLAYRKSDVVFALPRLTIEVAEACSGIRSTLGMLIVTLLATHLFLRSNWRKTALLMVVIPISLLKNAVRIVTLTLLATHYDMAFLTGGLHHDGGVLFMVGGLCLMYPVLWILVRSEEKRLVPGGVQL